MPELPEVETVRRGLAPAMEGARITRLETRRANLRFAFPEGFAARLEGQCITALARRAKYLLVHLENGIVVICHLGMSGSFRIESGPDTNMPGEFHHERSKDEKHDHVVFHLARGDAAPVRVVYNDPRRFGFMLLGDAATLDAHPSLAGLGVEPTGNALDAAVLAQLFDGKRAPLKAALLDQRLVAGLGNIYVCEALWQSGLSPEREARTLSAKGVRAAAMREKLADAIRDVIARAIAAGGSTLRDHMQADGTLGYFQHSFNVYDRAGQACRTPGCGGTIQRMVQSGRSSFYCPGCQR